jgi:hypothetical protein
MTTRKSIARRHYPKIAGFQRRTRGDASPATAAELAFAEGLREGPVAAGPAHPQLVSSAHGEIAHLLLTIPAYAAERVSGRANPIASAYKDLLAKLPPDVKYTVLTHESVEKTVALWFKGAGVAAVELLSVPDHLHFSVWAEDGYAIVEDAEAGGRFFVEPFEFPRYADGLIADFVSNNSELRHTQAPLYFQGGNILIGDDFFFIGGDYPANSLRYVGRVIVPDEGEEPADAVHRLYRHYLDDARRLYIIGSTIPVPYEAARPVTIDGEEWTEHLYVGNKKGTVQPLFHIDMFMTLAGRNAAGQYQVVVGDPGLAAAALGIPPWLHAMQEVFDDIARGLEQRGFVVHRNPLPLAYVDDEASKARTWYFATANNALVQITDASDRRIWLPAYGFGNWKALQATDEANVKLWESLGFKATLLTDFHPFAENLGAVHCIKKYLRRR